MHVLITGAAGFIGSHVTRALLADGCDVVGLDDLSTGHRHNLPDDAQDNWRFILGDVRDPAVCERSMYEVDAVVHLAARSSVPRSLIDPRAALEVNVLGGFNLLEAAHAQGVDSFIYASSSSIYGDHPNLPRLESMLPQPVSPYAATKASFEHLAHAWSMSRNLSTIGLRFFNVFGPRQDPSTPYAAVIPRFIDAALNEHPPTIYGDGTFTRDFTFVANVVRAVLLALSAPRGASGKVINVACGERTSILELWGAIAQETGYQGRPNFEPPRRADIPHSLADINMARRLLNFAPVVLFDEGIQQTVAWYRSQLVKAQT